jgi:hypothetical protein
MYKFKGTEEWLNQQLIHGAWKWAKMEAKRFEHDDPRNMRYLSDGKPIEYDELMKIQNVNGAM